MHMNIIWFSHLHSLIWNTEKECVVWICNGPTSFKRISVICCFSHSCVYECVCVFCSLFTFELALFCFASLCCQHFWQMFKQQQQQQPSANSIETAQKCTEIFIYSHTLTLWLCSFILSIFRFFFFFGPLAFAVHILRDFICLALCLF